jgi:hypothetical protein
MTGLRRRRIALAPLAAFVVSAVVAAQAPPKPAARAAARPAGTLAQVMRGIFFPNANLIFDVQQNDPAAPKKPADGGGGSVTSTYGNAYTGREVVENAAVALTDGVDLLLTPGRACQNGTPVPLARADFQRSARHASRGAESPAGSAHEASGKGFGRDQRPGRCVRELPRRVPRQGSGRQRRPVHGAAGEIIESVYGRTLISTDPLRSRTS